MDSAARATEKYIISVPTDQEIISSCQQGKNAVLALFHTYTQEVTTVLTTVQQRLTEVEQQIAKNSSNSGKPPSTDGYQKKNQTSSLRSKSGKKPGGQEGHDGGTLMQVDTPTEKVSHAVDTCGNCNAPLKDTPVSGIEKRQVFEIEIRFPVIEHQAEKKVCPRCGFTTTAAFPQNVTQPVQYDPQFLSLAVYFTQWQLVPLFRTQQIFVDLGSVPISETTILKAIEKMSRELDGILKLIESYLIYLADTVSFDESGMRVEGSLHWLHSASTEKLSYYDIYKKRGQEAMDAMGILPLMLGIAAHDHWKPYFSYACLHALCNAHHLRELQFITDCYNQEWTAKMSTHLLAIKGALEAAKQEGKNALSKEQLALFSEEYDRIVDNGFFVNPLLPLVKKRGRVKKTKPQNLLGRLQRNKTEVLRFMYDFRVSFDNNLAERDIRMVKLRQKISGCFRTMAFARHFCRVRSYLSTAHKHDHSILAAIKSVFDGDIYVPETLLAVAC